MVEAKRVRRRRMRVSATTRQTPRVGPRGGVRREWREPACRTKRHLQSAVPYLTRLLNGEQS